MLKTISKHRPSPSVTRHFLRGFSANVWCRAMDFSGTLSFAAPESDFTGRPELSSNLLSHYKGNKALNEHLSQSEDIRRLYGDYTHNKLVVDAPETALGAVSLTELLDEATLLKLQRSLQEPEQPEFVQEMQSKATEAVEPPKKDDEPLPKSFEEVFRDPHDPRAMVVTHVDAPYEIVDVNEAWVGLCGYSKEEAHMKSLAKLLQGPETETELLNDFLEQLVEGHESSVVITNYAKDGRKFRNRVRAGPLKDPKHPYHITHFVGILEDIGTARMNMA